MAITNRNILQFAGSVKDNILSLSGYNKIQEREILISTDTNQIFIGTGNEGEYTVYSPVIVGTTNEKNNTYNTQIGDGSFFFDTTLKRLSIMYLGQWCDIDGDFYEITAEKVQYTNSDPDAEFTGSNEKEALDELYKRLKESEDLVYPGTINKPVITTPTEGQVFNNGDTLVMTASPFELSSDSKYPDEHESSRWILKDETDNIVYDSGRDTVNLESSPNISLNLEEMGINNEQVEISLKCNVTYISSKHVEITSDHINFKVNT